MGQCRSADEQVREAPAQPPRMPAHSGGGGGPPGRLRRRSTHGGGGAEGVAALVAMGFDEIAVERALGVSEGDTQAALQMLVDNSLETPEPAPRNGPSGIPPPPPAGGPTPLGPPRGSSGGQEVDQKKVGELVMMGFELNKVVRALKHTNNDTARALDMLIVPGLMDDVPPAADANAGDSGTIVQVPDSDGGFEADLDAKRRLILMGFSSEEVTAALKAVGNRGEAALMYLFDEMERAERGVDGDGGGLAGPGLAATVGKSIFKRAMSSDQDKDIDDRFEAAGSGPARTFAEQVAMLKRMGYADSRNWDMEVDERNKTFKFSRGSKNRSAETRVDKDTFMPKSEKAKGGGTVMEVHGWLRSFSRTSRGMTTMKFVPASEGARFYNGQLSRDVMREVLRVRRLTLEQKKAWFDNKAQELRGPWEQRVEMTLRRSTLFEETMRIMMPKPVAAWRNPLNLKFRGEAGIDAGGLTRDWFQEILDTAFSAEMGMFKFSQTDNITYQIDEMSSAPTRQYRFVGLVLGKAILDGQPIGVHLNIPMLKNIVGYPITYRDLLYKNTSFHGSLVKMLAMPPEQLEYLYLTFCVPSSVKGKEDEIKPGGSDILVTGDNVREFVNLAAKYIMLEREGPKLDALLRGIYDVVPEHFLTVFDFTELELFLGGVPVVDVDDWKANTDVTGEGTSSWAGKKVVQWFWEIITSWSHEDRARFMSFATATSHVPPGGFKKLTGHLGTQKNFELRLVKYGQAGFEGGFPKAHTCFNRVDLPTYRNKSEMRVKMEGTLKFSSEFKGLGFGEE